MSFKKFDPTKVSVKKVLTLPVLSMRVPKDSTDVTVYFAICAPIHEKPELNKDGSPKIEDGKAKVVHTVPVINMVDNRPYTVVLSAVMHGILTEDYKDYSYIGKCFMAKSFGKINGKEYNTVEMVEIEGDDQYVEIAKSFGIYEKPDLTKKETKTAASSDEAE